MENWQESLSKFVKELGPNRLDEGESLDESSLKFLRRIADHNVEMNGEVRGVVINGEEVRGIDTVGWGSMAKVEVDHEKGIVKKTAERLISP